MSVIQITLIDDADLKGNGSQTVVKIFAVDATDLTLADELFDKLSLECDKFSCLKRPDLNYSSGSNAALTPEVIKQSHCEFERQKKLLDAVEGWRKAAKTYRKISKDKEERGEFAGSYNFYTGKAEAYETLAATLEKIVDGK